MGIVTLHAENANFASFRSAAKVPIRSLKAHFTPVQQGTGDASPTNIRPIVGWTGLTAYRAGKNLFDGTIFRFGFASNPSSVTGYEILTSNSTIGYYCECKSGEILTLSRANGSATTRFSIGFTKEIPANHTVLYNPYTPLNNTNTSITMTAPDDAKYVCLYLSNTDTDISAAKIQLEYSSTATTYEPYAGTTIPVTFPAVGKNLFDPSDVTAGGYFNRQGGINENANFSYAYIKVNPGDTVVYSGLKGANGNPCGIQFFDASKNFLSSPSTNDAQANGNAVTIPAGASYVGISVYNRGNATYSDVDTAQIELGSTATTYEPFTNTVYGGYVDLISGDVVGEWAGVNVSALDWTLNDTFGVFFATAPGKLSGLSNILCEQYKIDDTALNWTTMQDKCIRGITGESMIYIKDSSYTSIEAFVAGAGSVKVAYELATPVTLATLTPTELSTLLDRNNVWSSVGGKIEVDYDLHETKAIGDARKRIMVNTPHVATTTPAPVASFQTDMAGKLQSAKFGFLPIQNGSGNAFPEQTYNGSVVSFNYQQTKTVPLEFKANFLPKQEGTGDPSPTNVRSISGWNGVTVELAGKNMFDYDTIYAAFKQSDETFRGTAYQVLLVHYRIPSGLVGSQLTFSAFLDLTNSEPPTWVRCRANVSGSWINGSYVYNGANGYSSVTFTPTSTDDYVNLEYGSGSTNSYTFSEIQLEVGASRTSFAPYTSSTYPITFPAVGKNLFDKANVNSLNAYIAGNTSGTVFSSANHRCVYIPCEPNTTYTISAGSYTKPAVLYYANQIPDINTTVYGDGLKTVTTGSSAKYLIAYIWNQNTDTYSLQDVLDVLQIEQGSSATSYEPYTNSIYGGYVDLVNGVLTVNRTYMALNGTQTELDENVNWRPKANSVGWYYNFSAQGMKMPSSINDTANIVCDSCKTVTYNEIFDNDISSIALYSASGYDRLFVRVTDTSLTTKQAVNTYLTAHPIAFVYELATPITIPISPQTVSLLANSVNTVWSDADSVTVKVGNVRPISGWTGLDAFRTGTNVWDEQWEVGGIDDVYGQNISGTRIRSKNYISVVPNASYYGITSRASNDIRYFYYNRNKEFIRASAWAYNGVTTIPDDCYYLRFHMAAGYGTTYNHDISINYPATDTTYHAYTGGTTIPVTFGAVNKNLFPNADGSTASISISAGTQITVSAKVESMPYAKFTYADGTNSGFIWMSNPDAKGISTKTFTPEKNVVELLVYVAGGVEDCQVELGSTATPYVPYGTLYGGYVDVVRGEVVAEWASKTLNGTENWVLYDNASEGTSFFTWISGKRGEYQTSISDSFSNVTGAWKSEYKNSTGIYTDYYDNVIFVRPPIAGISTVDAFKTWLSENPVSLVYPLTTPIHHTIDPATLRTLRGVNNVWANTNGTIDLSYWTH